MKQEQSREEWHWYIVKSKRRQEEKIWKDADLLLRVGIDNKSREKYYAGLLLRVR